MVMGQLLFLLFGTGSSQADKRQDGHDDNDEADDIDDRVHFRLPSELTQM
jgi:hypothetical protein